MVVQHAWADTTSALGRFVAAETDSALNAYRARPDLVREHSNIEAAISQGGYGRKQLNELIQNAADAIKEPGGRIRVVLTKEALYCANEGQPLTDAGVKTLMLSHSSAKRDDEIGKFGLGFKSVIQITDAPSIFSRTCSISWDQERNKGLLQGILPGLDTYPTLRIAAPVNPDSAAESDPVLAELMDWASTVVKLPLSRDVTWLSDEMAAFPKEFLLFSDNVATLELDDRVGNLAAAWTATRADNRVTLSDGKNSTKWLVFTYQHVVSQMAAAEAGSMAAREQVKVTWAVPVAGSKQKLGRFWNYFPTQHETSLRGIVNAAFKMNEDRYSMLETLYNEEILTKALPLMVAGALELLSPKADPGLFLEVLPSRPKEFESWADKVINKPIFAMMPFVRCLPDRAGKLQFPADIKTPPGLEDATRLSQLWDSYVSKEKPWLHPSALIARRESQVVRILSEANIKRASVEDWLQEVAAGGELQNYENALELAAVIDKSYPEHQAAMRRSSIVLMGDGSVQPPIVSRVFLPLDPEDDSSNVVSYDLMQHGQALSHLRSLDLQAQDGRGTISRVATQAAENYGDKTLAESLWRLTRGLPVMESVAIVRERTDPARLLVQCRDSKWRPMANVWLPGEFIPSSSVGDEHLVVDAQRHGHDLALFQALGAHKSLSEPVITSTGPTFEHWKTVEARRISQESRTEPSPVSEAGIRFLPARMTNGLHLLVDASPATRAKVTQLLLDHPHYPTEVQFTSTYRNAQKIEGPDLWWIRTYGVLKTPLGLVEVAHCVGRIEGIPSGFLPYPGDAAATTLGLPVDTGKVPWRFVLAQAERALHINQVHELYGALARLKVKAPKELLVPLGKDKTTRNLLEHVVLATDQQSRDYLVNVADQAVLYTGNADLDAALTDAWGIPTQNVLFQTEVEFVPQDGEEPAPIAKLFPFLKRAAGEVAVHTQCVPCSSLEEVRTNDFDTRRVSTSKSFYLQNGFLYFLAPKSGQALLSVILNAFASRRSTTQVMQTMRELKKDDDLQKTIDKVHQQPTDAGKVAELVGRQTLRNLIPDAVVKLLEARGLGLTDERLFDIVSNLHGNSLLKVLKPALEEAGIEAPTQFTGGRSAQEFVRELGFSPALAGKTTKKKPDREEVVGPVGLNPLHDYQESTSGKICALLRDSTGQSRGLVQLPTGAGKTRVAVESVIRDIKAAPKNENRLIIWIAQSHELCEQAIDTWTYVWQAAGVPGERMTVSRLWGGNSAAPEKTKLHVVVATIDTLSSIYKTRRQMYSWMSDPDLVIIDEAHGATAPSYTTVLSWFGRSFRQKSRSLLGLSATPFRGSNEDATARLVTRFGGNLIEPDEFTADNAHDYLQRMGVLAKVNHRELSGITLRLMPSSAGGTDTETAKHDILEERIDLQQVANSTERNQAILNAIKSSESQGPALVFAASVQHAEALAAVLTVEGIPAAAISGKTDPGHRRTIIEDFRSGKIRVLTNFDVLTQGFDAPKVDAVYVCRPTFSPNKYIQMIGRGLRGPLNGGSEEVLIVNIKDNLEQHGHKLAFTQLDYLWKVGV